MNLIKSLIFILCLIFYSCSSNETLIAGQIPENDLQNLKGKTVYVFLESEIKSFLEGKKQAVQAAILQQNELRKKCEELTKQIPSFDSTKDIGEYNKSKKLADDCSAEYETAQNNINQIYFENMPQAKISATIRDDGQFDVRVPMNNKYVVILPNHSITWINANSQRKFHIFGSGITPNGEVVW